MTYTSRITITAPSVAALRDQVAATIAEKAAAGARITGEGYAAAQGGPFTATLTFGAQK